MKLKRTLKYMFFLLLCTSIALLYGFTSGRNLNKNIEQVYVDFGDQEVRFLSETMVNKLLIQNKKPVQNQAKSKLDLYQLEKRVLENPYVENAAVYTSIDGDLFATVKERTPIARVLTGEYSYYLDKKGVRMPLSENFSARVPIITGISQSDSIEEIHEFVCYLHEDDFLQNEIVGVHKKLSNDYELITRSGEFRIEFGTLKNKEKKFSNLKAFYSATLENKTIFKYKIINLKFHNQVVGIK